MKERRKGELQGFLTRSSRSSFTATVCIKHSVVIPQVSSEVNLRQKAYWDSVMGVCDQKCRGEFKLCKLTAAHNRDFRKRCGSTFVPYQEVNSLHPAYHLHCNQSNGATLRATHTGKYLW